MTKLRLHHNQTKVCATQCIAPKSKHARWKEAKKSTSIIIVYQKCDDVEEVLKEQDSVENVGHLLQIVMKSIKPSWQATLDHLRVENVAFLHLGAKNLVV